MIKHILNIRHIFSTNLKSLNSCEVDFWIVEDCIYILFTDINDGVSVTNASEQLATEMLSLLQNIGVDFKNIPNLRFFETYRTNENEESSVDEITYTQTNNIMTSPKWETYPNFWSDVQIN